MLTKNNTMKKTLTPFLIALIAIILAVGCNSKDKVANDPKSVVIAFFETMAKKDIDGLSKYVTKESKGTMDLLKKAETASKSQKDSKKEEKDPAESLKLKDLEYGDAKIDGDNATVSIKHIKKNETIEIPLKKEGGDWKVDFTMETLMKMNMDNDKGSMNDINTFRDTTGVPPDPIMIDTLKKGLEDMQNELKKLDPEKMKEALKELEKLKDQ